MSTALDGFSLRETPQTEKAPNKEQVKNNAGGYVFKTGDMERARRFLILGSEATYYATGNEATRESANVIVALANTNSKELVDLIVEVSTEGRAPKNDYALFALAIAGSVGTDEDKRYALNALPKVARTGTHVLQFVSYVENMRGWGRALKRAVANWYSSRDADNLAYQVIKYRNRAGFTHRDVLRLAHPVPEDERQKALYKWITDPSGEFSYDLPAKVYGFLEAKKAEGDTRRLISLIKEYELTWEMLPDSALKEPRIWEALLPSLPYTALMRNLSRLARLGVTTSFSENTALVVEKLTNEENVRRSRVHPLNMLVALRTYESGRGLRGSETWTPEPAIIEALEEALYMSFGNVEPSGKRTLLALDVSGSMNSDNCNGLPLTPREASTLMAMVSLRTEGASKATVIGFTTSMSDYRLGLRSRSNVIPLKLHSKMSLEQAIRTVSGLPFCGTDCALPMLYALENKIPVDNFVIYTDNETYAGEIHPFEALNRYREEMGIDAKLTVVGMTATRFSIADPSDPGMLDIVGFDTSAPQIISEFARGLI